MALSDDLEREIFRLINSPDARDDKLLRQAVRDARVCVESRRGKGDPCDCFCCTLTRRLRELGKVI